MDAAPALSGATRRRRKRGMNIQREAVMGCRRRARGEKRAHLSALTADGGVGAERQQEAGVARVYGGVPDRKRIACDLSRRSAGEQEAPALKGGNTDRNLGPAQTNGRTREG